MSFAAADRQRPKFQTKTPPSLCENRDGALEVRAHGVGALCPSSPSASRSLFTSERAHWVVTSGPNLIKSSLRNLRKFTRRRCIMRNHDFAAGGFLALTAASLALLCSSLLALAFT